MDSAAAVTVLEWMEKELARGHQAYIICPLIEESEALDVKNATEIFEHMQSFYSPRYQVGLLHGKMKNQEKDDIMQEFKDNQLQLLVSTTVIEVGVNVPNATVMLTGPCGAWLQCILLYFSGQSEK